MPDPAAIRLAQQLAGDEDRLASPTPPTPCPVCGEELNGALSVHGLALPKPGDATLCVYCTSWAIYQKDMTLRPATAAEQAAIKEEMEGWTV